MQQTPWHTAEVAKAILSDEEMREAVRAAGAEGALLFSTHLAAIGPTEAAAVFEMLPRETQSRIIAQNMDFDFDQYPHLEFEHWLSALMLSHGIDPNDIATRTISELGTIVSQRAARHEEVCDHV